MAKYRYGNSVAIINSNGKIIKEFKNKLTTSCCDKVLSNYVINKYGDELGLKINNFTLMKLGS